jgi:hypothetical protein
MIDAITEGKYYAHSFETTPNSNTISISFLSVPSIEVGTNHPDLNKKAAGEFWFSTFDEGANFLAKINNPRTAREIAGALVAWANRKEGDPLSRTIQRRTVQAIVGDDWNEEVNTADEVTGLMNWQDVKSDNHPREEWYRRNVGQMSQETKDRNLKDLMAIKEQNATMVGPDQPSMLDLQAAIQILLDHDAR